MSNNAMDNTKNSAAGRQIIQLEDLHMRRNLLTISIQHRIYPRNPSLPTLVLVRGNLQNNYFCGEVLCMGWSLMKICVTQRLRSLEGLKNIER